MMVTVWCGVMWYADGDGDSDVDVDVDGGGDGDIDGVEGDGIPAEA